MRPPSLAELQSAFKRYLLAGENEAQLAALVVPAEGVAATARLDVYRNAYYVRLEEALAHDFPVLRVMVGDAEFGRLTAAYLSLRPSTCPSIRWLGEGLADWLLRERDLPALAELARLEWAVLHAFDAEDAKCLVPQDLGAVPAEDWPMLRLSLHPSVTLLSVSNNVREVWSAVRSSQPPPALQAARESLVIWRSIAGAQVEAFGSADHLFLQALASGSPLRDACDLLAESIPPADVPAAVAEILQRSSARGWLRPGAGERDGLPEWSVTNSVLE